MWTGVRLTTPSSTDFLVGHIRLSRSSPVVLGIFYDPLTHGVEKHTDRERDGGARTDWGDGGRGSALYLETWWRDAARMAAAAKGRNLMSLLGDGVQSMSPCWSNSRAKRKLVK